MQPTRRAVIDVGTNSVKLLVADVAGRTIRPVIEESEQTRLGTGFFKANRLQPTAIAQTAQAVAQFAARAKAEGSTSTRIIATSAARDATNPTDLVNAVEAAAGVKVEIISGDQEADLVFRGVTSDPELEEQPLLLLDVGGGSTEFILGRGSEKRFERSFRLGTVRLLERFPHSDPPTAEELAACRRRVADFLLLEVRPNLGPALRQEKRLDAERRPVRLVGTGGTATILARMEARMEDYDRARIEATRLTLAQVKAHAERLWSLPLAERRNTVGLPKKRADVILFGTVIYEAVMEAFEFDELRVSTRGLRFAAVMDAGAPT